MWTKSQQPDIALAFVVPLPLRPVIALDTITFYLWKLLWPVDLGPDYGRTPQMVLAQGNGLLTAMIPLGLGALLWRWRGRCAGLCLAGGVFLAALTPVLGLIPFMFQAYSTVADRYVYLAMIGVALGVGWLSQQLHQRRTVVIAGTLLISLLAWRSTQQVQIWRDTASLLRHALQVNPESAMSHNNLGLTFAQEGRLEAALTAFQTAVQLQPNLPEAHYNLGKAFTMQGQFDTALVHLQTALQLRPGWAEAHNNLGVTLASQGQHAAALAEYAKALLLKPGWADVYYNMGHVLAQQGRYTEALTAYRTVIRRRALWVPASISLARLLTTHFSASPQAIHEAVELAEQACRSTENRDATALYTLALAYHTAGQSFPAVQAAEKALMLAEMTGNPSLVQEISTLLVTVRQRLSRHEVP
jgi:tetratricopeptide (TPR) repeat protein